MSDAYRDNPLGQAQLALEEATEVISDLRRRNRALATRTAWLDEEVSRARARLSATVMVLGSMAMAFAVFFLFAETDRRAAVESNHRYGQDLHDCMESRTLARADEAMSCLDVVIALARDCAADIEVNGGYTTTCVVRPDNQYTPVIPNLRTVEDPPLDPSEVARRKLRTDKIDMLDFYLLQPPPSATP